MTVLSVFWHGAAAPADDLTSPPHQWIKTSVRKIYIHGSEPGAGIFPPRQVISAYHINLSDFFSMRGGIRQWLKARRSKIDKLSKGDSSASEETPMPFLDSQDSICHQRRIPPSSSHFFQKLPSELRHRILCEAFGDRTVHIYLGQNYPLLPEHSATEPPTAKPAQHGGAVVPLKELTDEPRTENRDTSQPMSWQWWSCVCHRRDPQERIFAQPHQDVCLNGRPGSYCTMWSGKPPANCQIGVAGWLRSCWQA
jgi:hypothetical protein